jgi:hypothetical protein
MLIAGDGTFLAVLDKYAMHYKPALSHQILNQPPRPVDISPATITDLASPKVQRGRVPWRAGRASTSGRYDDHQRLQGTVDQSQRHSSGSSKPWRRRPSGQASQFPGDPTGSQSALRRTER